ncbi:CoxG family protein [Roseateles terrae]|uniref:Carbon monoxide dehydrogenase subunit G n=1 Tax=Roseateles terrae TaxID=431060 RepID=A0ABR6GRR5_9BURK|nr:hypothetical protein [Roseateles terrae]MBB3194808.1 carbon monoxide dehydrogenase subunit G [Roseateles terrae]
MPTLTLHDDLTVPVPRATAWSSLHDLPLLAEALATFHGPQASLTAQPDGASYRLTLPGFEGQVQLRDVERPSRLRFSFEGQGDTTGAVQGQVQCRLELLGDERTLLHWSVVLQTEQQPGGLKLRSITALKKQLQSLEAVIRARHASHLPVPMPPVRKPWPQRLLDWYLGWFAGIFNGTLYPAPKPKPRRDPPAK